MRTRKAKARPWRGRRGERGGVKFKLLLVFAFFGAVAALVWMAFLPTIVAARIEAVTGFPTRIERLSANPFRGTAHLEGLVIENPTTFEPRMFVVMNAFEADLQVFTLFQKTLVFDRMKIDLARAAVVTNTNGSNNLDLFREAWSRGDGSGVEDAPVREKESGQPAFLVHELELSVGTIELLNLTSRAPSRRELELNFNYTYRDISAAQQLLVPALLRRMAVAGGAFEGLVPEELGRTLGGWLGVGGGFLQDVGRRATDTLKTLFEKLEESRKP